jgi:spore coat protein A
MLRLILSALLAIAVVQSGVRAATIDVYVYNTEFSINLPGQPIADAVVNVGDTVRWVWIQGNHTTTSVAGSTEVWDAPINSSSQTFSRIFNTSGVYWYYCIPHGLDNGDGTASGMAGTITVVAGGQGACCLSEENCIVTSPADCANQGGTYQGDGTSCDPNPCDIEPITVTLAASKDNILYETVDGSISNALGRHLYVGNQNTGARRRGVIHFDTVSIPVGATIQSATLELFCNQSSGAAFNVAIHRLLANWGEGSSQASGNEGSGAAATTNDATWLHGFYPTIFWGAPGGDFVASASTSTSVSTAGAFVLWQGANVVADVQHWVNMPNENFGWTLRGDEATSNNTKRFDSRQSTTPANHPALIVTYLPPGPIGACCISDGTCTEVVESTCLQMGGTYQGDNTMCDMVSCPLVLEPFVDALPLPAVAQPVIGIPGGAAHYEIAMTEQYQQLHRDLLPTRVWGYAGSYPGPTIEARRDQPVTVVWKNDLRVFETGQLRTTHALAVDTCLHGPDTTGNVPVGIVHLHGGKVEHESDGYPEFAFPPGQQSSVYTYPNDQPASTIWYHDHALGITRLNVMMGMAGFYLIRDDAEDALDLPNGEFEIAMAIQDRSFNADGSLQYPEMWHDHFFGNHVLVNGKVWPYLNVKQGKYRFRTVNGSTSRAYTLALSNGATFWQIGTDLGLLEAPVALTQLTVLPGERADVVMDFAGYPAGTEIILTNSAPAPFPGFPGVGVIPNVMKFIVQAQGGYTADLPSALVDVPLISEDQAIMERTLNLELSPNECAEHGALKWTINGLGWHDVTEFPHLNSVEIWAWRNMSGFSHPMHMHLVAVQVLDRQAIDDITGEPTGPKIPPSANEMGWKDTVHAPTGFITRVITKFEGHTGPYPYHCHILEHEDHEMMRQFEVLPEIVAGDVTGNGIVDVDDLLEVINAWGICPAPCAADLTGNGIVDVDDLLTVINNWS